MALLCQDVLLLLVMVSSSPHMASSEDPILTYENMLKSLIDVNEKRVHMMKSFNLLQDLNVHSNLRISENSAQTTDRSPPPDQKTLVLFINPSDPKLYEIDSKIKLKVPRNPVHRPEKVAQFTIAEPLTDEDDDSESEEGISMEDNYPLTEYTSDSSSEENVELFKRLNLNETQANILRKNWRNSCDKKAASVCKKACIDAGKNVCSSYKCIKRMKAKIKKECKYTCKHTFITNERGSDSESDSGSDNC